MQHFSSKKGFTFIEVVITVFILILMLVFYSVAFTTNRLARIQQHKDIALRVLTQKLESLRAAGYSGLGSSGSFSDPLLTTLQSATASTTISDYNADIKQVVVGVSWIESSSTTMYLSAATLIGESGGL